MFERETDSMISQVVHHVWAADENFVITGQNSIIKESSHKR